MVPSNASEVIARLWQGGKPKPGVYDFDLIVLTDMEYQPPAEAFPGAQVMRVMLNDFRPATPTEYAAAAKAAEVAAEWYRAGKRILITCGAGLNRSGLVTGLTMRNLGFTADDAVALIRRARGPNAIKNSNFVAFIRGYQPPPIKARSSTIAIGAGALATVIGLVAVVIRRFRT